MDRNLQRPLIWIVALLLTIPAAFAATIDGITAPLQALFGSRSLWDIYFSIHHVVDAIILIYFFGTVCSSVMSTERLKHMGGKKIGWTMGVILAISFVGIMASQGITILWIGPYALLIALLVQGSLLYGMIEKAVHRKGLAFLLVAVLVSGLYGYFLGGMQNSPVQGGPSQASIAPIAGWNSAIFSFLLLGLVVTGIGYALSWLWGGNSSGGIGALGGRMSGLGGIERDLAASTRIDPQMEAARKLRKEENKQLKAMFKAKLAKIPEEEATIRWLEENVKQMHQYVESVVAKKDPNLTYSADSYKQAFEAIKPAFQERLRMNKEQLAKLVQGIDTNPTTLEKLKNYSGAQQPRSFDKEGEHLKILHDNELRIQRDFGDTIKLLDENKQLDFGPAANIIQKFRETIRNYQPHLGQYDRLQREHVRIADVEKTVAELQKTLADDVKALEALREKEVKLLKQLPLDFAEYESRLMGDVGLLSNMSITQGKLVLTQLESLDKTLQESSAILNRIASALIKLDTDPQDGDPSTSHQLDADEAIAQFLKLEIEVVKETERLAVIGVCAREVVEQAIRAQNIQSIVEKYNKQGELTAARRNNIIGALNKHVEARIGIPTGQFDKLRKDLSPEQGADIVAQTEAACTEVVKRTQETMQKLVDEIINENTKRLEEAQRMAAQVRA